jgi:hypothetical protein
MSSLGDVCWAEDFSQVWSILSAMVAWHRAFARLTRHSKTLIRLSCKGIEYFWILGFLSDQAGLSVVGHATHGLTTWECEAVRYWGFERWSSHASLPVYFQLSVQAIRCCNHLAQPCEVFHSWGGKKCGTLIDWSRDMWPESGDTTGVVTSTGVEKCDQSQEVWPKSGYTTEVISSNQSRVYDRIHAHNRSHEIPTL